MLAPHQSIRPLNGVNPTDKKCERFFSPSVGLSLFRGLVSMKSTATDAATIVATARKFAPHVTATTAPDIFNGATPVEFLRRIYENAIGAFGSDGLLRSGYYRYMGLLYGLTPHLRLFVYKSHGSWHEAWAPNRVMLRTAVHGRIACILDGPEPENVDFDEDENED